MDVSLKPIDITAALKHPAPKPQENGHKLPPINILLVDDQPANLLALESLLDKVEYNIVKASSGQQALRCMLEQEFALVLLDVLMPGMDGFETAGLIRQRSSSIHTPIIFITAGSSNDTHVNRGYSLGAVDYIYKPIIPEILRAKINVFVDLFRKTQSLARSEEALRTELEERKKADEARHESEEKFRELFSRANDAIIVLDSTGGKILDANIVALKMYGYTRRDFLKQNIWILDAEKMEGDHPKLTDLCYRTIFSNHRRKDGTMFPAEITYGTYLMQGRKVLMTMVRDITERKKAEETERLKEREAFQRQMVATVSHELRTPIAAIKASAETLRRGGVADEKSFPRFIGIIESQADRLSWLVDDLLILAELESGKFKPEPRAIEVKSFMKQFITGIRPLAKRKQISIRIEAEDGIEVWVDQSHLTGIFQNLTDNAIKYNKKRGSLVLEARRLDDKQAQISIRDTGIGIPEGELNLIFDQFHRTDTAKALSIKGTGLGLYIIKTMVGCNGGKIWAESVLNKGSVFHFTLPLAQAAATGN